jgi:Hedgehog amino-terminal signalling domain
MLVNKDDIRWFKTEFQNRIIARLQGTPYSVDMLTAIACQESGEIWRVLRTKSLTVDRIVELCVGDTFDDTSKPPRKAFPRNKAALVAEDANGQTMYEIARQALKDMAQFIPGYQGVAQNPNKFCHGYGIFQYDLQHYRGDSGYFLQRGYANFDTCLEKCLSELNTARNGIGFGNNATLTDMEMAFVAIAYNTGAGNFKKSKGLAQGHGGNYGQNVFDYMQLAKTVSVDPGATNSSSVNATTTPALPPVIEISGVTHMPPKPKAGGLFTIVVELNRAVGEADGSITVALEAQRLVANTSGFPETRPASFPTYFDPENSPGPIVISPGSKFGTSNPIKVRKDATVPQGEVPVNFPEKVLLSSFIGSVGNGFLSDAVQIDPPDSGPTNVTTFVPRADDFELRQKIPNKAEKDVVGLPTTKIKRGTPAFQALVRNENPDVAFKDEEGTGADRMMTPKLRDAIDKLAALVKAEWPGVKVRVTEAWDENSEHAPNSVHYEARGADLTTSDIDRKKYGRLARLAVDAGFDWVFYENNLHVHASVKK